MDVIKTLQQLNSCFAPSGCEKEISEKIAELAKPYADKIYADVMGSLVVVKYAGAPSATVSSRKAPSAQHSNQAPTAQDAPRLMLAAHMDTIGLIVTYIEDCGLLRFGAVGSINPENLKGIPLRFANGTAGTIGCDGDATKLEIDKMFIDIGATSKKGAERLVKKGDMAIYDAPTRALGKNCIVSPYIDNRAGVIALLIALEKLQKPVYDCYFVFSVQEEVGQRGAKPAAFGIDPQYGIVCDTTLTDDIPFSKHNGTSTVGGGAAIKIMDKSVICHPEMVDALKKVAEKKKIPYQTDVIKIGLTDGGQIRKNAAGVWTGGISIPTRYIHSPQEVCCIQDIEAAGKLMATFAETKLEF